MNDKAKLPFIDLDVPAESILFLHGFFRSLNSQPKDIIA
jgi:hypothetical protein